MENITEFDGIVWHLVNKYLKRFKCETNRTREDLYSEARIAALIAIAKYDASKSASIKTFVYTCVRNRLENLSLQEDASPEFILEAEPSDRLEGTEYNNIEDVEFDLTMKALLNTLEYNVYFKTFVEGCNQNEVSKSLKITSWRVKECLRAICSKFKSLEESHHKILTQIELQRQWLAASPV